MKSKNEEEKMRSKTWLRKMLANYTKRNRNHFIETFAVKPGHSSCYRTHFIRFQEADKWPGNEAVLYYVAKDKTIKVFYYLRVCVRDYLYT